MLIPKHLFVSALHDEQWIVTPEGARRVMTRTDEGTAWTSPAATGFEIVAKSGLRDAPADVASRIRETTHIDPAGTELDRIRDAVRSAGFDRATVRIFRDVAAVIATDGIFFRSGEIIALSAGSVQPLLLVTSREHLTTDLGHLTHRAGRAAAADHRKLPLVWRNGSGGVLLHELAGHPAEHSRPTEVKGISVVDDPSLHLFEERDRDDCGLATRRTDLSGGVPPSALRRPGYREAPSRRMTAVAAIAKDSSPVHLPPRRIEVLLTAGGSFDPLADTVTVEITDALVADGDSRQRIEPFTFSGRRSDLAALVEPAGSETTRYPGVICSDEGVRLPVSTLSIDLTTRALDD